MQAPIDLRSDTVTKPTPEMLEAMVSAEVGDDVLGDDPTVAKLEELATAITGHEAGVFVPSGTMGNQIAIASHTNPGDSILCEDNAHILFYEVGAPAVLANVFPRTISTADGIIRPEMVKERFLQASLHTPGTKLLCLENTHNRAGGTVTDIATHHDLKQLADELGIAIHLDGARVFNAATHLGLQVKEITQYVDSVSFCLSKGLGAPVGSILTGSHEFIEKARIWRKRLGGGMRQSGILAAVGIYALRNIAPLLKEDHRRARELATAISELPGLRPDEPQTNILMIHTEQPADWWCDQLNDKGVWCYPMDSHRIRLVFHHQVDDDMMGRAVVAFMKIANSSGQ